MWKETMFEVEGDKIIYPKEFEIMERRFEGEEKSTCERSIEQVFHGDESHTYILAYVWSIEECYGLKRMYKRRVICDSCKVCGRGAEYMYSDCESKGKSLTSSKKTYSKCGRVVVCRVSSKEMSNTFWQS